MIKAVLFDLDGVLIETEYRHVMIKADICRQYGLTWTDDTFYLAAGRKFTEVLPDLFPDKTPEELKAINDHYYRVAYTRLDYHALKTEGAGTVLRALHNQGYKLAIVSTSNSEKLSQVIGDNHWEKLIDVVITSSMVSKTKPDPESYLQTMDILGLKPEECIVVEDSRIGIEAAHRAGCIVICRRDQRYPCNQEGADYYVDDLLDVVTLINELSNKSR